MPMVLSRSPLEPIGMNGGAALPKRRSARLSNESPDGAEENEPPAKKSRAGATSTTINTKEQDGGGTIAPTKKRKVYEQELDGFTFTKSKRAKSTKEPVAQKPKSQHTSPTKAAAVPAPSKSSKELQAAPKATTPPPKPVQSKARRQLPVTPEVAAEKRPRRSKRLSAEDQEHHVSPHKPAHAKSHARLERTPSPNVRRPLTIEKKQRKGANGGVEEQKTMRIQLPFQDTPVIRRNKEMRKISADTGSRRSSSGMRGRRASSLIDEGRGNALPHSEVPTSEFYKHINEDLAEPRRMRTLLGWCGTRALPPKPDPPKHNTPASNLEFQALQAARVVQEELSKDLGSRGALSDWFSRDDNPPSRVALRKKPNPRNVANAAKAEELEAELERLKKQKAEWAEVTSSADPKKSPSKVESKASGELSPLRQDLLDSPQRKIYKQLQALTTETSTEPPAIQQRLRNISDRLEFTIDQFADGIHALSTVRETGDRLADRTLNDASNALAEGEKKRKADSKAVDPIDALRGLARLLNGQRS